MTVTDLKKWALRCEREDRPVQAALILQLAWEQEHDGVPWLKYMQVHGIEIPKEASDASLDSTGNICAANELPGHADVSPRS